LCLDFSLRMEFVKYLPPHQFHIGVILFKNHPKELSLNGLK
jgi:hypothetical protein